ncbi:MAG TPA: hypothetical protein VFW38_02465, partial [Solirubrobacteraceae bacterium]|nr:hypothetical protein [Solirubrobacteraceae bacterium]
MVVVEVYDIGAGSSTGPVTMTDVLPPGLEAISSGPLNEFGEINKSSVENREKTYAKKEEEQALGKVTVPQSQPHVWKCEGTTTVTCVTIPGYLGIERPIKLGYRGRLGIAVRAVGQAGVGENHVTVAGGGALSAGETTDAFTIDETPAGFGLAGEFDGWLSTPGGTADTQAGSHPFDFTLSFGLNTAKEHASGPMRDIKIALPPGIVGDPHAVPQCTRQQLLTTIIGSCPVDSTVGVDEASQEILSRGDWDLLVPVYNMVPPAGVPAEFAFSIFGSTVLIDAGVRSGTDYGITTISRNVGFRPIFNTITLWGVPGESVHDPERCGFGPLKTTGVYCGYKSSEGSPRPLLTLPTSCEGPQRTTLTIDSWDKSLGSASESFVTHDTTGAPVGMTGCEDLAFPPSLSVAPDTSYADTPAGLTADVKVPQEGLRTGEGVATANVKDTTVVLPEGVAINPGQAAGLGACGSGEDGLTTPAEEARGEEDNGPAHCPNASKVGTDEIETPLLSKPLKGGVYVLPSDPPHVKLLVSAEGEGVFVKLVAKVDLDEATGRLTTTFEKTPELPFTDFKLSFSGGAQAALSTPTQCGTYTTMSDFTPWSSPFEQDAFPSSSFVIAAGPNGAPCPFNPLPFGPSMIAGSTTDQAGGFTNFSLLLTRPDDQQRIGSLQFKTPEGLLGMIGKVPLCPEPQASQGDCSSSSQIGHTVVEAGPGPYPLVVPQPGQSPAPIYLTGGYKGAPYGLSIVVPLHVGPFVLPTQVVRAKIEVDPRTTELTVTTDALPQIIAGVPADLRAIDAVIDRPGFMFNPTGCESSSFSGTATSSQGAKASISSHFQMGSCRSLTFKPAFKVSTSAKTSRKDGASLDAKITYPKGPFGENQASIQSNVKSVKVDLPKQLPSRLTTLQKACPAKTFEANPAFCPSGSKVGSATAVTPVLPVPLMGPAYFVSYGGAKFPELVIVLQGYGVTVDLHGETFINEHTNITSSTFRQVPDVPIESFELKLPEGPNSALAAIGNLCAKKLVMPTMFTGQNGARVKQA